MSIYDLAGDLWRAMKADYQAELERRIIEADTATIGNLVNRAGRAHGISGPTLFTGPEARAYRYASRELLDHWEDHGRLSLAQFEAEWIATRGGLEAYVAAAIAHYEPTTGD